MTKRVIFPLSVSPLRRYLRAPISLMATLCAVCLALGTFMHTSTAYASATTIVEVASLGIAHSYAILNTCSQQPQAYTVSAPGKYAVAFFDSTNCEVQSEIISDSFSTSPNYQNLIFGPSSKGSQVSY